MTDQPRAEMDSSEKKIIVDEDWKSRVEREREGSTNRRRQRKVRPLHPVPSHRLQRLPRIRPPPKRRPRCRQPALGC